MTKIKTINELKELQEKYKNDFYNKDSETNKIRIVVGMATCGIAAGAGDVYNTLKEEIEKNNIENIILVWWIMCAGGEFRTRDLQIMSIALVGEPLEFTK